MPETDPLPRRLERRLALVKAHVDCENRHDFEGILRTFGTSVAYEDQAWRTRYPRSEGVRQYYQGDDEFHLGIITTFRAGS